MWDNIVHGIGRAKAITFAAVPDVIANGQQIDYQQNWKGRGYDTYTFAAPITYEWQKTYLGVIVAHDTQSNRYYLHEVIDGSGNLIFRNEENPSSASDRRTAQTGVYGTVAENGFSTPETIKTGVTAQGGITSSSGST